MEWSKPAALTRSLLLKAAEISVLIYYQNLFLLHLSFDRNLEAVKDLPLAAGEYDRTFAKWAIALLCLP
ncbi:hypothetical protein [Microcoleus sp. D2_18a_B4]|uniref:hypothetical protein n=1 Tax=Microcoleus sp. D2_18a_B4 TaxID=3055329 RepID=UPI002FD14CF1